MKKFAMAAALLLVMGVSGCASTGGVTASGDAISKNKLFTVDLGSNWQVRKDLDKNAEMQLGRKDGRAYILVYAYKRSQIDYPGLDNFAKLATESLAQEFDDASIKEPVSGQINGNPSVVYAMHGTTSNTRLTYFSAAIEGRHAIYWVASWCLSSDYDEVGKDMMKTLFSLSET